MKNLTFKVSSLKESSVISLIKEINKISCRIFIDFENGLVIAQNVNDTLIVDVIELVNNYYTILNIDIGNSFEEQVIPVVAENSPTVLEPHSEDDLVIKKVEFENEYVENRINILLKTAYWALYNRQATEKDIGNYIHTCRSEIYMRYSLKPIINFTIGDIVDVNFGSHLPGETIGSHIHAIVCNILKNDNLVYVVPLTKARTNISFSLSYLPMDTPQDATYDNEYFKGGTVLVDKGKYVRAERFHSVIGKTKPAFFEKLLYQLASTFDFTDCLAKSKETTNESTEISSEAEESENEVSEIEDTTDKVVKNKTTVRKAGIEEVALLETIGFAFDKLDSSKKVEEQIESFLTDIGMTTTEKMVTQSFIVACDIKKINYENVLLGLHNQFPQVKEELIKNTLKEAFKNWLDKYPTLAEKCPKISLMALLKIFAKKFA